MENGTTNGAPSEFFDLKAMHHIVKPLDRNQKVLTNILHDIGNTPLVKLTSIPKEEGIECDMYAKCEFLNPGGSIKDRIAFRMITDAEERGILIPKKSVIIEPTSGNTGVGLALAAAVKGYRCIIVLPEKMSDEKVNTMKALGAKIIRTPTEAPSTSPESNLGVARRLVKEIPNAVLLDQYNNPNNPVAHYDGTAEEILWSLDDDVDMVVIGAGTGGTISGTAHKIKERNPNCVVVGVDPYGSILAEPDELNKTDIAMYEVEGIGYDFFPKTIDRKVVDRWVKTDDFNSLNMARRLIQQEGLLCGGSSGAAMWGALQAARGLRPGQKCVVILPDNIRNYLTKFVSDQWMEARDLKVVDDNENLWWWNQPVTEELAQPVSTMSQKSSPVEALAVLARTRAAALVALDDKQLITGVFTADDARKRITNLSGSTAEPLSKFLVKKFYKINLCKSPTIGKVSRMLDISPYVIVVKSDSSKKIDVPVGIITSGDLLHYVTKTQ